MIVVVKHGKEVILEGPKCQAADLPPTKVQGGRPASGQSARRPICLWPKCKGSADLSPAKVQGVSWPASGQSALSISRFSIYPLGILAKQTKCAWKIAKIERTENCRGLHELEMYLEQVTNKSIWRCTYNFKSRLSGVYNRAQSIASRRVGETAILHRDKHKQIGMAASTIKKSAKTRRLDWLNNTSKAMTSLARKDRSENSSPIWALYRLIGVCSTAYILCNIRALKSTVAAKAWLVFYYQEVVWLVTLNQPNSRGKAIKSTVAVKPSQPVIYDLILLTFVIFFCNICFGVR